MEEDLILVTCRCYAGIRLDGLRRRFGQDLKHLQSMNQESYILYILDRNFLSSINRSTAYLRSVGEDRSEYLASPARIFHMQRKL